MDYQEGEIIICRVMGIVKTTVFVETFDGIKGSIVMSEIAPGRIRNIRDYVVPNKVIVCKVLQVKDNHLFLSLRRVKLSEQKEVLEDFKKEKSYEGIIKTISKNAEVLIKKISEKYSLREFLDNSKENPEILKEFFSEEESEKIEKILVSKKEKEKELKKEFSLNCISPNGIEIIKNVLGKYDGIKYLGNSMYVIIKKSHDPKKADQEIREILKTIEENAEKSKCNFILKK
ncbi:hypothetical protein COU56_02735 [Candidatus Pacearchaeota archaeon CG10_big_fil_rev_8_21_14_0_10_31_9]|nr:MAG: hypothetical protein AUJ62_03655 [Candidatus Pacearchaeota archaeon CG1_02_32_21]PIN94253.1 MAG: hypothetical protein COU56_02735 [Candidatus Pacearchaeota archaeon CG10_big_fil_rev_8_21_14_0_10_31_9]